MTVETTTARVTYTGAGTTGPFSVPFYFLKDEDLKVIKTAIADGTETTLVLTTDYVVSGAADEAGGSVTLTASLSSAYRLTIIRDPDLLQSSDYPPNDKFPATTHERVVDKLTMIAQRLKDLINRSFRLSDGDVSGISLSLSNLSASKLIGVNADGTALEAFSAADVGLTPVSNYVLTLLDDTDAATARETLGAAAASQTAVRFQTKTAAEAYNPTTAPDFIELGGYSAFRDAPSALYRKVAAEPAHVAKFQIAQGSWYEIAVTALDSRMVGVHDSASDAVTAFQNFVDAAASLKVPAIVADGETYDFPSGTVDLPAGIDLRGHGATLRRTVDLTIPLLSGSAVDGGQISGLKLKYTAGTTETVNTTSAAVYLDTCDSWEVRDIVVEGAFYYGIYLRDCMNGLVDDCEVWGAYNRACYIAADTWTENIHVSNCLFDGYAFGTTNRLTNHICNTNGFGTGQGRNITFSNCTARYSTTSPSGEGFGLSERILNQKLVNCHAYVCATGFLLQEANGYATQRHILSNCVAQNCTTGFYGVNAYYASISNCRASACADGFYFNNCNNSVLHGNIAENCTSDGFEFDGSSTNWAVSGNAAILCTGTGFKSAAGTFNISAVGNVSIANGTAYSWSGTGHNTASGNI